MNPSDAKCPIETTLSLINGKWKILIMKELLKGPVRYGELNQRIASVSSKVLTQQLREMEADGLVLRIVFAEVPPRVEYELTEMGGSMLTILKELRRWGLEKNTAHPVKCSHCKQCE